MKLLKLSLVVLALSWTPALADDDFDRADDYCSRPSGFCPSDSYKDSRTAHRKNMQDLRDDEVYPQRTAKKR